MLRGTKLHFVNVVTNCSWRSEEGDDDGDNHGDEGNEQALQKCLLLKTEHILGHTLTYRWSPVIASR